MKTANAKGQGIKDIWKSIVSGYNWIKKNKPVSSTVKKIKANPLFQAAVNNIPVLAPVK
jgi:hypothetical protein